MKLVRAAFLLMELLALILLVTLLITFFIGGQAQLLKMDQNAIKKIQGLNRLLNEYEKAVGGSANPVQTFQIEKYSITHPTVIDSAGKHQQWAPKLACCMAGFKQPDGNQSSVWLPWIVFPK